MLQKSAEIGLQLFSFNVRHLKPNFTYQFFYFQVYGNLVEENVMYRQLQKICRENVCDVDVFRVNLGKF